MNMKNITDHMGIIGACACVFHCIALPVLLVAGALAPNDNFHIWSLIFTIVITGHALWHGYKQHCKHIIIAFGGLGLLCLIVGVGLHYTFHEPVNFSGLVTHDDHGHSIVEEYSETAMTLIGSILLIASHAYNLKFKRACCSK